jgi:Ca-activated chloride channel family protein
MKARLSHPYVATGRSDVFVTVDLQGVEVPGSTRAPVNLALVIDRSGSMSGFKLQQAKQAARQLVSQLKDSDRLAIIHYGSDVRSLAGAFASEANKQRMLRFIDNIWDEGGTNISSGLSTGREQLLTAMNDFKVNRLILISDGQPTEGLREPQAITRLTGSIRALGISVSSIGVGTDFNEDLMSGIAEAGAGAYAFLQDASQLSSIFSKDLTQASTQVARNVTLQFELPQGVTFGEVLGYRASVNGSTVSVALPDFAASQLERLVLRVTVDAAGVGRALDVSDLKLAYTDLLKSAAITTTAHLAAMVTDKREEVVQNRDKEATVYAARALSALNTRSAADALAKGDRAGAEGYLQQNAAVFEEAAQVSGSAAVANDVQAQAGMLNDFRNARDEDAVQAASKSAKKKARVDFGLVGSTY